MFFTVEIQIRELKKQRPLNLQKLEHFLKFLMNFIDFLVD